MTSESKITIEADAFGWYLIRHAKTTLQAFRTERECRQWLADTHRIRTVKGIV